MLQIGAASAVINNELGRPVQGASVNQVAKSIRDDLEANALYIRSPEGAVLLIGCDLAGLVPRRAEGAREAIAERTGIDPRAVIIAGTHTHAGPSVIPTSYFKDIDEAYLDRLHDWLVTLSEEAIGVARPGKLGWGEGAARIGYNRRCCWADGSHSMHGDAARADFTGFEGPCDPRQIALFAKDTDDRLIAVLHNNTSHPTCFYGADFYSADFPGAARALLREVLGPLPVIYVNGAFGDISIESQAGDRSPREGREQKMMRAAHLLAGETLRLLHECTNYSTEAAFAHEREELQVRVRLPDEERVQWARETLRRTDAGEEKDAWSIMRAYATAMLQDEFGDNPIDSLPIHAVRIGDLALTTQPCELYCQFGLDIKRRSPAAATAVCGIADGYNGYCPTLAGIIGGGYSGEPFHWARLAPEAGYQMVDVAARLLHRLWQG